MRSKRQTFMILTVSIVAFCAIDVNAEVFGPLLEKSTMELGLQGDYSERWMGPLNYEFTLSSYAMSLVGRYGLTRNATISWELYRGSIGGYTTHYSDQRVYAIGAGVQLLVWDGWGMRVTAGLHYKEMAIFNEAASFCQESRNNLDSAILVEKGVEILGAKAVFWGGPGRFSHSIRVEKGENLFRCSGYTRDSLNNWGFSLGMNLVLWDHLVMYSFFNYVDTFNPRFGVTYRF